MEAQFLQGRSQQIQQIEIHLEEFNKGPSSAVIITGEAGIGKSALCETIGNLGQERDWTVASVECGHLPSESAFLPIEELCNQVGITNALDLFRRASLDQSENGRTALFQGVTTELEQVLRDKRLMLIFDDSHLADESTKALLGYILLELHNYPIMAVLTGDLEMIRESRALGRAMSALIRSGRCPIIELSGLDSESCIPLVQSVAGLILDQQEAERLVNMTGGNPFLIRHLAQFGFDPGASPISADFKVPPEIRFAVLEGFQELEPLAYKVLGIGAMIGDSFAVEELSAAVPDVDPATIAVALAEGGNAGAIQPWSPGDTHVRFKHSIARNLLANDIPVAERFEIQLNIANTFESLHKHEPEKYAAQIADRFEDLGAMVGWDKCIEYSILAGRQALNSHAYEDAVSRFTRALELQRSHQSDAVRAELLVGLATAELHIAVTAEERHRGFLHQNEAYELLSQMGNGLGALKIAAVGEGTLAGATWNVEFLQRVIDSTDAELKNSIEYVRLSSRVGLAHGILLGDLESANTFLDEAERIARKLGAPQELLGVQANRGSVEGFWHMDHTAGLEQSLEVTESPAVGKNHLRALADTSSILIRLADPRVPDYLNRLERLAADLRDPTYLSVASVSRAMWALLSGDFESVERYHSAQRESGIGQCQLEAIASISAFERGAAEQGQDRLNRMIQIASKRDQIVELDIAISALTLAYCSRFYSTSSANKLADAWARQILDNEQSSRVVRFAAISALILLGGDVPREATGILTSHQGQIVPFLPLAVDHAIALVAIDSGNPAGSTSYLDAAVRTARTRELPFIEAQALVDRVLVANGPDSRRSRRVRDLAKDMSCTGITDRMSQGSGNGRRPGGLTPKEQQILILIAQGKTNQQVADEINRTIYNVQSHAYNIFRKLNVSNRAGAIAKARELGML